MRTLCARFFCSHHALGVGPELNPLLSPSSNSPNSPKILEKKKSTKVCGQFAILECVYLQGRISTTISNVYSQRIKTTGANPCRPKRKICFGDSWETLTERHVSLELLNRPGSDRTGTQFVLSPRHVTVVSFAIFGGVKKRASSPLTHLALFFIIKKQHKIIKKKRAPQLISNKSD